MGSNKRKAEGKLLYFEPNPSDGRPINNEDLSIYVGLTANRKERTIISVSEKDKQVNITGGGDPNNPSLNVNFKDINFIGGSSVGGGQSLTTNYTELNTQLGDNGHLGDDLEGLGISNIDIEFNTSYAPIVKIDFVDVRGGAVFGKGNKSKYRVFFDLPYPIFNLTVKGFYGKAVSYCLHMVKWNGNLNSKTGNFEIKAEFIGFTYALLTDTLLGYMRAVPRTSTGKELFNEIKREHGEGNLPSAPSDKIITINELLERVHKLNDEVTKLKRDDDNVKKLQDIKGIRNELTTLKERVDFFIGKITKKEDSNATETVQIYSSYDGIIVIKEPNSGERGDYDGFKESFVKDMKESIEGIKTTTGVDLTNNTKLTEVRLINDDVTKLTLRGKLLNSKVYKDYGGDNERDTEYIVDRVKANVQADDTKLWFYDVRHIYTELDKLDDEYREEIKKETKAISDKLDVKSRNILGFRPTAKNLFKIITLHVELLLDSIKSVAQSAEASKARQDVLKALFNRLNIKVGENAKDSNETPPIYPFPQYNEITSDGGKETWLGSKVQDISAVDELVFVEELLKALLEIKKEDIDKAYESRTTKNIVGGDWFPLNANEIDIDSTNQSGYKVIENATSHEEYTRMLFLRSVLLFANNKVVDEDFLKTYGKIEAQNMTSAMINEDTKKAFLNSFGSGDKAQNLINLVTDRENFISSKKRGLTKVKNPPHPNTLTRGSKGFIFSDMGGSLAYVYIAEELEGSSKNLRMRLPTESTFTSILPIDGNYDGQIFFKYPTGSGNRFNKEIHDKGTKILLNKDYEGKTGPDLIDFVDVDSYLGFNLNPKYGQDAIKEFNSKDIVDGAKLVEQSKDDSAAKAFGNNPFNKRAKLMDYAGLLYKDEAGETVPTSPKSAVYLSNTFYQFGLNLDQSYKKVQFNGEFLDLGKWIGFDIEDNPLSDKTDRYPIQTNYYLITGKRFQSLKDRSRGSKAMSKNKKNPYAEARDTDFPFFTGYLHSSKIQSGPKKDTETTLAQNRLNLSLIYDSNNKAVNLKNVYFPYCEFTGGDNYNAISLFGSRFYYNQSSDEAKAFLFLHTFPFFGLSEHAGSEEGWTNLGLPSGPSLASVFKSGNFSRFQGNIPRFTDMFTDDYVLSGFFQNTNGFTPVPKALALFIGALCWRLTAKKDPIKFGRLPKDIFNENYKPLQGELLYYYDPTNGGTFDVAAKLNATKNLYAAPSAMHFQADEEMGSAVGKTRGYKPIPRKIANLPNSVKDKFIQLFVDWVGSDDGFQEIKNGLEIHDGNTGSEWSNKFEAISGSVLTNAFKKDDTKNKERYSGELKTADVVAQFPNIKDNYIYLSPLMDWVNYSKTPDEKFDNRYNYHLHMKAGTEVQDNLVELFAATTLIKNNNYKSWLGAKDTSYISISDPGHDMIFSESLLKVYIKAFVEEFEKLNKVEDDEKKKTRDSLKDKIFNTVNDDIIKLNIYRTLSSMYIKWVAGSDGALFAQCGSGLGEYANKVASLDGRGKPRLIDTFRFLDRAFNDIGDEFIINPAAFTNLFTESLNKSAYDLITNVLSNNNMDFIPLPTFVDFKDMSEVEDMFRPKTYKEVVGDKNNFNPNLTVGPSFICMYVGQTSNNLDIDDSQIIDDGIYLQATSTGSDETSGGGDNVNLTVLGGKNDIIKDLIGPTSKAGDIISVNDLPEHKHIPVIGVSYGQQNQNIFKDLTLDQAEFTETEESLIIIDEMSQWGDTNKKTAIGQNLFNIFQTRSYNAKVEAMGCPLIQPMMYFQLNNMPIFRGIYTIIKVNHKITPHNMTTTFTGNRIRAVKTPLLENETIYMNLIGSINSTSMTGQPDGKSGSGALNGRNTERWEEQGGYVTYEVTPNAGLVFQQTEPQNALGDSFAMKSVGVFMEQLALKWHAANNGKTQGSDKLYINCFGARGGGGKKSHSEKSLHYVGRAVDLRPMMKTKKVQKWHVGQSNYSSENNKKFIQMAIDLSDKNTYGVKLNNIILNDKALITHFSKIKNKDNKPLVFGNSDHNNHIHMEFEIPDDVVKMMEEAELEEQITSNAVDGQASEKTAERPKNPEEHLGKI